MPLKVSIITVCYNSEKTIEETIRCVLSQDYQNIEYIIIDGDSNDNTLEVINKYREKVDILISEKDAGIYDAMNKGIKMASGDIIGILNSDDTYLNEKVLSKVCDHLSGNTATMGVYSNLYYVKKNKINRVWETGLIDSSSLLKGNIIPHPTLFVRDVVYKKCDLYDCSYGNAADFEFITRIILKYKIKLDYLNFFSVKMKLGGSSNKNLLGILQQNLQIIKILKTYDKQISPIFYFMNKVINRLSQKLKGYFSE